MPKIVAVTRRGSADRADGFWPVEQHSQGFEELVVELLHALCDVACNVVTFEMLPELLDRVEIGTVR